ncbi:unnamed protein product [Lasius platythorax]|uniref:Uncharacterized protein n=1 Tax=Lasius platythorax TaxID=488582 RepID=A0AAV2N7C4_9HYME
MCRKTRDGTGLFVSYSIRFHFDAYYTTSLAHVVLRRGCGEWKWWSTVKRGSTRRIESTYVCQISKCVYSSIDSPGCRQRARSSPVGGLLCRCPTFRAPVGWVDDDSECLYRVPDEVTKEMAGRGEEKESGKTARETGGEKGRETKRDDFRRRFHARGRVVEYRFEKESSSTVHFSSFSRLSSCRRSFRPSLGETGPGRKGANR